MPLRTGTIARLVQITAVAIVIMSVSAARAQVPTSGNVFFGYSYYNATSLTITGITSRQSLNGWDGSFEGKVFHGLGLVADFSKHYGSQTVLNPAGTCAIRVVCSPLSDSTHIQNFLFGPRVSISVGKFRPFGEVLFGVGHVTVNEGSPLPDNFVVPKDTAFATAVGGGLDYKIIKPVAWRFQGDYVQTRFFGATQNNVRISTGIVFRF